MDFGLDDGTPYIVMELLEGESLAQRLARVGRLSLSETTRIVSHIARALTKAHEAGIVHRDLKADNVFLVRNLDEELAKVLDFGIAKVAMSEDAPQALTSTGAVVGSPHTMSPEQARGLGNVDHRADLWALGIIAFQCATGTRPFESEVLGDLLLKICTDPIPVPSSRAPLPPGFDSWFARATERDPSRRFQSALEMANALRAVVEGTAPGTLPSAAPHSGPGAYLSAPPSAAATVQPMVSAPPPAKGSTSGMVLAIVGLALALFAMAGVLVTGFLAFDERSPFAEPAASSSSSVVPSATAASAAPSATVVASGEAPTAPPTSTAAPKPVAPKTAATSKTASPTPPTAPTATSTAPKSDACQKACARISNCGEKCKFGGPCVGAVKALADCVNSKGSCFEILSCGG